LLFYNDFSVFISFIYYNQRLYMFHHSLYVQLHKVLLCGQRVVKMKMHEVKKPEQVKDWADEEDFYTEDARIVMIDDDELSAEEIGFMDGYEGA